MNTKLVLKIASLTVSIASTIIAAIVNDYDKRDIEASVFQNVMKEVNKNKEVM